MNEQSPINQQKTPKDPFITIFRKNSDQSNLTNGHLHLKWNFTGQTDQ